MNFKIDENLPVEAAALLQQAGGNALSVPDQGLLGASDSAVFEVCRAEGRVLVTLDTDFADLRSYSPRGTAGIMVLRLK